MKKRVVSLLVMLIALAFATTGVVSAANVSATAISTCPSTAAAQCTSAATSAFYNPRSPPCPIIKTDDNSMPAVVNCVAVTKCCQYKPVVVKAAPMTAAMSAPAWVPQQAEKIVQAYQNQPRTADKGSQSTPGAQNGSVIVVDTGKVDNSTQNRQQNNTVTNNVNNSANTVNIGNANVAAADVNSTLAKVNIAAVDGTATVTNVNSGTNEPAPPNEHAQS